MNTANSIVILIPAKNEEDSIAQVLGDLKARFPYPIVVINDASTDNTVAIAQQAGARVLTLSISLGAWGAIQTGLRYALREGFEIAITMDADGQHEADSLPALLAPIMTRKADVTIGAFTQRGSFARHVAWSLFRKLSGLNLEDLTSGLRAYTSPAIRLLASPAATLLDYQDMGVLMLLQRAQLRIQEVPISMRPRLLGKSRIFSSWWAVSNYMLYTAILCLAHGTHYFRKHKCPIKSPQPF
ncbi:MAG: hypothetical protein RL368_1503 [Pseudomonadota bacterium]|jgi:glycosyltransferase involved in cell wall biosynthesis